MDSSHCEPDTIPLEIIVKTDSIEDHSGSREFSESLCLDSSLYWLQDYDSDNFSEASANDEIVLRTKGITERQRQLCLSILNSSDETQDESDDEWTGLVFPSPLIYNYSCRNIPKDSIHDCTHFQDDSCDIESIHCTVAR
jgi:hypothetical protein